MSASMPWIKLYTEMLDDAKIGRLSTTQKWRFVEILLLAGECDAEGYLVVGDDPMTVGDIAWRLRADPSALQLDLETLAAADLMAKEDGVWMVKKFSERQGRSQAEKRARWRARKQRQRDKEREQEENPEDVTGDTDVTPEDVQRLEERREEEEAVAKKTPKQRKRKSSADERTSHPAIQAIFRVTGRYPSKDQYDSLIQVLGDGPKEDELRECFRVWVKERKFSPVNFGWAVDWYINGIPDADGNRQRVKVDMSKGF